MPTLNFYGAELSEAAIKEFFPINATHPNFNCFLFQYRLKDGNYYLEAFALDKNGGVIKPLTLTHNSSSTPLNYTSWIGTGVMICVTRQLKKIPVSSAQTIKSIELTPQVYKSFYTGFAVKILVGQALVAITEKINPSPPATSFENTW